MYNEAQKNNFIASGIPLVSQAKRAVAAFGHTAPFEEALGKDICTFTLEELQDTINRCFPPRSVTRVSYWKIIRSYIKWCWVGGVAGARDHTDSVNIASLDKIKTTMVANPAQLHDVLNQAFHKEELNSTENAVRLFCWMVYAGIPDVITVTLETKNVDLDSNSIVTNDGERYVLPSEAAVSLRSCATMQQFKYIHPLHAEDSMLPRCDGDQLLRGLRSEAKLSQIKRSLSVHMKDAAENGRTSVWLSTERIILSGLFYRIYEQERAGIKPDFRAVARGVARENGYGTPNKPMTDSFISGKSRLLNIDYQAWKLAMYP